MAGETYYYNRRAECLEQERVLGDGLLKLAYATPARYVLSWPLFWTSCCSRILGWAADRGFSRRRIQKTVESLGMDLSDYVIPEGGFASFNDFFARRVKPGARPFAPTGVCSPADCRLMVYPELQDGLCIPVKGASFTVAELLGDAAYADDFRGGSLCVFRLCPSDYHRYHFTDDGTLSATWKLPGRYYSVHPIALEKRIRVFTTNVRQVSILELAKTGRTAFIEVGAFGVGSIRQTFAGNAFRRGDEKGYFTFGGSTVIMVFKKGAVAYDKDILEQSAKGVECLVKAGDHIGD